MGQTVAAPAQACLPPQLPSPIQTLLLQAVNAYQRLAQLLRGEYPPGLLPPTPQGYVVARIRELAGASVVGGWQQTTSLALIVWPLQAKAGSAGGSHTQLGLGGSLNDGRRPC